MTAFAAENPYRLACLELHGGNQAASYAVELPGLVSWVSCDPMGASGGGDLYYLSACSKGNIARVVLADVAGHGDIVSAAAVSLRDALREHVDHWDQSMLIRRLNDSILKGAPHSRFATAFLASFYRESGELIFTNAGHPPPLWYRAAAGEWSVLRDSTPFSREILDLPLGMIEGTGYSQTGLQLDAGDILLLYTDGVIEAADAAGDQLGLDRLLEAARGFSVESAGAAGRSLLSAVARFRGTAPAEDDITVIALERRREPA